MNKNESLAFLQSCIDNINAASCEEIAMFQESYALNCTDSIVSSIFEFIPPMETIEYLYETSEIKHMKISNDESGVDVLENQWNYNIRGNSTNNEQSNESLPYAA